MLDAALDALAPWYDWIKAGHVVSMVAWMAGMFYLPRLFVYHAERAAPGSELDATFKVMERRLLKAIINPAMVATFAFGTALALLGGLQLGSSAWGWVKLAAVLLLGAFHGWLVGRWRDFAEDRNTRSGRTFRIANEAPTLLLLVIVVMVVVKPF